MFMRFEPVLGDWSGQTENRIDLGVHQLNHRPENIQNQNKERASYRTPENFISPSSNLLPKDLGPKKKLVPTANVPPLSWGARTSIASN